jgi:hypothetical protein
MITMCEISELRVGQTAGWEHVPFGRSMTGTIEYVSMSTGWVTVKLDRAADGPCPDGSSTWKREHVTHTTLRAASLTPCDEAELSKAS